MHRSGEQSECSLPIGAMDGAFKPDYSLAPINWNGCVAVIRFTPLGF